MSRQLEHATGCFLLAPQNNVQLRYVLTHLHYLICQPGVVALLEADKPMVDVVASVRVKASRHQDEVWPVPYDGRQDLVPPSPPPLGRLRPCSRPHTFEEHVWQYGPRAASCACCCCCLLAAGIAALAQSSKMEGWTGVRPAALPQGQQQHLARQCRR